jgi:pyrrolysine biosynthesis protein PylC
MRLAVIGGGLQGVEACYLAGKAAWEVTLIDKNRNVPAKGLCDNFLAMDVCDAEAANSLKGKFDAILPALENGTAIYALRHSAAILDCPIAFDFSAYSMTVSKVRSAKLFSKKNIPVPRSWPSCNFPVIVKPDGGSGSEGIRLLHSLNQLDDDLLKGWATGQVLLDEFVKGPSYSLEVSGTPQGYTTHEVTDLFMDDTYDCKCVTAPTTLDDTISLKFKSVTLRLAEALCLKGIMDVEIIVEDGHIFVLEIDARLPSQTPSAVYLSTDVNLLEHSVLPFIGGTLKEAATPSTSRGVVYMHVHAEAGTLQTTGERAMKKVGPLHLVTDFFGADEAIGNYRDGKDKWSATLLITGTDRADAIRKKNFVVQAIMKHCRLQTYLDKNPDSASGELP